MEVSSPVFTLSCLQKSLFAYGPQLVHMALLSCLSSLPVELVKRFVRVYVCGTCACVSGVLVSSLYTCDVSLYACG